MFGNIVRTRFVAILIKFTATEPTTHFNHYFRIAPSNRESCSKRSSLSKIAVSIKAR